MPYSILCVEDDPQIANLISYNLNTLCDQFDHVSDGKSAKHAMQNNNYDLLILDLKLPDINGIQVCKTVRKDNHAISIIMLTAYASDQDCILGLESGADDYMTKPFNVNELKARVKAVRRRQANNLKPSANKNIPLRCGDLNINIDQRKVKRGNEIIDLTSKEFDLLTYFAQHEEQVFSRSQLLDAIWGHAYNGYDHTVNSHINRLRAKIEKNSNNPGHIVTIWGVGYKFVSQTVTN